MLKKLLLLTSVVALFFSCSKDDTASNNPTNPVILPDSCLLTSMQYGPTAKVTFTYDTNSFLPVSATYSPVNNYRYSYQGNQYKVVTLAFSGNDTTSIFLASVDADKKAITMDTKTKVVASGIFQFNKQNITYNADKTLQFISSLTYNQPLTGGNFTDSVYTLEKLYWTNGNLTLDSVFILNNKGTAQETKTLSAIKQWEFGTQPDIKGLSEWLVNPTFIAKLTGTRSKNLCTKAIVNNVLTGQKQEVISTYLLNSKKWPSNVTYSGDANYSIGYGYTCYKRK